MMPGLLSERGKESLNRLFVRAATANVKADDAHAVAVEALPGTNPGAVREPGEADLVVLTLASYSFRMVTIFQVSDHEVVKGYFCGGNGDANLLEVFGEIGNRCCGAMSRELGRHFPHMGMSTPFRLENKCLDYIDALRPTWVGQYRIRIGESVSLRASLCFCAYASLDFQIDPPPEEEPTGALELF